MLVSLQGFLWYSKVKVFIPGLILSPVRPIIRPTSQCQTCLSYITEKLKTNILQPYLICSIWLYRDIPWKYCWTQFNPVFIFWTLTYSHNEFTNRLNDSDWARSCLQMKYFITFQTSIYHPIFIFLLCCLHKLSDGSALACSCPGPRGWYWPAKGSCLSGEMTICLRLCLYSSSLSEMRGTRCSAIGSWSWSNQINTMK